MERRNKKTLGNGGHRMSIAIGTILYAAGVMTGIALICIVQTRH